MQRIDLSYWYKVAEILHPLTELSGTCTLSSIFAKVFFAHREIGLLLPRMGASRIYATKLIEALEPLVTEPDLNLSLEGWKISNIAFLASQLETTFKAELSVQPTYNVEPKGAYNVDILTSAPLELFPPDLTSYVSGVEYDIDQLGKCLAFEIPTAAAFHMHRLNEAVLLKYWEVTTKGPRLAKKESNMGAYLKRLKARKKKDAKLIAVLTQIKDLHRNPCIHPEVQLSTEDAIELYGIIRSSISRMLITIRLG